jgi:Pectinacetylesterase
VGDAETYGYQFRGARIVDAVLSSLVATKGMGNGTLPAKLIFGGCSAGGRGAAFSLDYVSTTLERAGAAPGSIDVYGLLDAALWIDVPPEVEGVVSQQCQTAALAQMVNATRLGAACEAAYPGLESWKCLFGARAHTAMRLASAL